MSRRSRDETTIWCDACKCHIQAANIVEHENGRRHRSNLASRGISLDNITAGNNSSSDSQSRSRSTSADYQQVYSYQGNNTMTINPIELTGGRNSYQNNNNNNNQYQNQPPQQQQQQQQQQRPQRNYPSTMLPPNNNNNSGAAAASYHQSSNHNNNNNNNNNMMMMMSSAPSSSSSSSLTLAQRNQLNQFLSPLYPTNPTNPQFSSQMHTMPQQYYQQQYSQNQQRMNHNNNNNYNKNNNGNDDDDEDYQDDDDEVTFCDSTGRYRVNGVTGGTLSLLCSKCSRLSSPSECSQRQQCPGCGNQIAHLKHVYVSNTTAGSRKNISVQQHSNNKQNNNNTTGGTKFTWSCPKCTFVNADSSNICLMCNGLKDGSGFFNPAASSSNSNNPKDKGVIYVDDDDDRSNNNSNRNNMMMMNNNKQLAVAPSRLASVARANAEDIFRQVGATNNPSSAILSRAASVRTAQQNNTNPLFAFPSSQSQQYQQQQSSSSPSSGVTAIKQEKQDVNAIFAEMDESDNLRCVFCLQSTATHRFMPCEHTILCSACTVEISAKFRAATENDIALETQNKGNSSYRADSQILRCFYCRQLSKYIEAAPIAQKWRAPPHSTFPWIGGDARNFDKFIEEIKAAGRSFIYKQCRPRFTSDEAFERCVRVDECRWVTALDKFKKGWTAAKCPEGAWSGIFGYHGTPRKHPQDKSLWNIAKHSFDPARRARNNHNPGEYFSMHFSQSLEYASGTNTLVLAFLLRGPQTSMVEDFCYIVNNPVSDLSTNYCLPLFLVHYERDVPRWCVPRFPYMRWIFKWQNDEETDFIAYDHSVNHELNRGMCLFFANRGMIPNAPRQQNNSNYNYNYNNNNNGNDDDEDQKYEDDEDDDEDEDQQQPRNPNSIIVKCCNMETEEENEYEIDFNCYTQTNVETSFTRKILPTCVPALPFPKTLWIMCAKNTDGRYPSVTDYWTVVDIYAQRSLCDAYYTYQKTKKAAAEQQQQNNSNNRNNYRGGRGGRHNNHHHHAPAISVTHLFDITIFEKKYQVNMNTFRAAYVSSTTHQVTDVEYPLSIVDA